MFSFFINLAKLVSAIWHGIKQDAQFRILMFVLCTLLVSATVFYSHEEGWSTIDALYFSVMTMSTIGYGDFVPTTTLSKLFTIMFSLLSIGVFVALVSKLVAIILEQKKKKLEKHHNSALAHGASDKRK